MEASLNGPFGRTALGQGVLKIGRAPDNTLVINDPQSSSHHAEVGPGFGGNGYQVTDLNSTNGTFINEQPLTPNTPRSLNAGDVIRIGSLRLAYEASNGQVPSRAVGKNQAPTSSAGSLPGNPTALGAQPTLYPQAPVLRNNPPAQATQPRMDYPQAGGFNQPGYPPPGGFNQPAPRRKKSRVGLWIGLILLLLLVIGGSVVAYTVYQNRSTPEKTLQAYCTALQHSDAQGYYDTLSHANQVRTDLQQITTGFQLIKLVTGGITACTPSNVQANDPNASALLSITPARGGARSLPVTLVDENGQWKMSSARSLPGL